MLLIQEEQLVQTAMMRLKQLSRPKYPLTPYTAELKTGVSCSATVAACTLKCRTDISSMMACLTCAQDFNKVLRVLYEYERCILSPEDAFIDPQYWRESDEARKALGVLCWHENGLGLFVVAEAQQQDASYNAMGPV